MRALFLVALLLNAAFLYWQFTREAVGPRALPQLATGVERLQLVDAGEGEAGAAAQQQRQAGAGQPSRPEALKPAPPCLVAGPIVKKQLAEKLQARIWESTGASVINRLVEAQIQQYWIYLAPAPSLAEAQRLANALAAHGLKDYQILASPGKKNAISLGLFNEKDSAQRRFEQIRELGYDPRIDVIDRVANRYELLIRPDKGEWMQPARIIPLLPASPVVGLRRDDCQ